MKLARIFTYNEGPWYTPSEAMHHLGHKNKIVERLVIKMTEFEKRRLFSLKNIKDKFIDDDEFLRVLTESFATMAGALVDQYRAWEGSDHKKIQSITVINSQGIPQPGFAEILKELLGVNEIPVYHITGMNCGSTLLALQHLYRLRKKSPLQEGECDLLFSIEVPSATLRKRKLLPLQFIAYDTIISDGAGLVAIESAESGPGLEIVGHRNFLYPKAHDTLISRAAGRQVEHGVSPELIEDLRKVIKPALSGALTHLGLHPEQIKHWILHPGGVNVVNCVSKAMGFTNETMRHALDTIRSQGNSMSSLILYVLKRFFESNTFNHGDLGVLIGIAPGFEIQTITVRHV